MKKKSNCILNAAKTKILEPWTAERVANKLSKDNSGKDLVSDEREIKDISSLKK